ncbi:MAG: hypothetical protein KDA69_10600 [Planctomycetaceae bacterium]|nr:hypothetical protein [Planctomycetaceae bacterium]
MKALKVLALTLAVGAVANIGRADDKANPGPQIRTIVRNLDNPSGIAIQPETGHIFVSEHRGVLRLSPQTEEGKKGLARAFEVNRYPTDIYGKGPMYDVGPLGVAFLDGEHIIVADGSRKDAEELVRVYKVGTTSAEKPAKEDSAVYTLGPITAGDTSAKGEGNFYGIAITNNAIHITSNGDDTKGWVLRSQLKDGKPGELEGFIATKQDVQTDAPCGITVSSSGDLVVGQMGEVNVAGDSLLLIYDAKTGKLKKSYETGLSDITGMAYSPATGKLYATDFSWAATENGGLFELTISGDKCEARKVCELDKPTAIVFDDKGNALITAFGTAEEGSKTKPGHIVRVPKKLL